MSAMKLRFITAGIPILAGRSAFGGSSRRATGLFLQVSGPAGVVVSIAGWMLDPVVCAG